MELFIIAFYSIFITIVDSSNVKNSIKDNNTLNDSGNVVFNPDTVFNGVYSECFLHLSYSCLQRKTLLYLKELDNLSEVSVIGDYVKFVKINTTINPVEDDDSNTSSSDELAFMIDKAVDDFFENHVLKFNALGRDISIPRNLEKFVGRKKRKGGGGGDSMMGGHGDHDFGKKKMMMMAMMCMKMKLMMMVPAMMGMMGMMSFKGMMFSMMSFLLSKMMLLMKILERKGGVGGLGGGGAGGDGGWAAGGTSGGAWMPAGGQDFGSSSGGGYDANGQWQSRSIDENLNIINKQTQYKNLDDNLKFSTKLPFKLNEVKERQDYEYFSPETQIPEFGMPEISFVKPIIRFNNKIEDVVAKNPILIYKKSNVDFGNDDNYSNEFDKHVKDKDVHNPKTKTKRSVDNFEDRLLFKGKHITESKTGTENKKHRSYEKSNAERISRKKRSILDLIQNSYAYWINRFLGINNNRRANFQKYKVINGIKYVYYPFKIQRPKTPKEVQLTPTVKFPDGFKPIITAEDFNKGEIVEGAVESRMNRKKFIEMKDTVNDTVEDNPWE